MKTTLLILAAGMGSRYGGLKQIDAVGPAGEMILDYSMYDAVEAGFEKIVFVIRREFADAFKEKIPAKLESMIEICYAYQELDSCLGDFELPTERVKPWGTGHAILVAKDLIDEPFAIINADDYYGPGSFKIMQQFLSDPDNGKNSYAMVGYSLCNTLSENGTVARGICQVDEQMLLKKVVECLGIKKTPTGASFDDASGKEQILTGDEIVSMNLWGFGPSIFGYLDEMFKEFLAKQGNEEKSELFIPSVVDSLINEKKATAKVLTTDDRWFGITYKDDMPIAKDCVKKLIENGVYPERLWDK